jgi:hypothetical protein
MIPNQQKLKSSTTKIYQLVQTESHHSKNYRPLMTQMYRIKVHLSLVTVKIKSQLRIQKSIITVPKNKKKQD